jgi:hypothetical protein
MRISTSLPDGKWREVAEAARAFEELGFDEAAAHEVRHDSSAAACPEVGSMPNLIMLSLTHGALTALIHRPRGLSSAAARTKPSRPAFTSEIDALSGIIIEPRSSKTILLAIVTWPHQLAASNRSRRSCIHLGLRF